MQVAPDAPLLAVADGEQFLFEPLALGDVRSDGDVLPRFAAKSVPSSRMSGLTR